jgi:hypothetical protein
MRARLGLLLILAACGTVDPALTPGIDPARTDPVYRNAYADGCAVGQGAAAGALDAAGFVHAQTRTGPHYREGWTDGFETCSGQSVAALPMPAVILPEPFERQEDVASLYAGMDPAQTDPDYKRGYRDGCAFARDSLAAGTLDAALYERRVTQRNPTRRAGWIDGIETCSEGALGPSAAAAQAEARADLARRVAAWESRVDAESTACIRRELAPYGHNEFGIPIGFSGFRFSRLDLHCSAQAQQTFGPRPTR